MRGRYLIKNGPGRRGRFLSDFFRLHILGRDQYLLHRGLRGRRLVERRPWGSRCGRHMSRGRLGPRGRLERLILRRVAWGCRYRRHLKRGRLGPRGQWRRSVRRRLRGWTAFLTRRPRRRGGGHPVSGRILLAQLRERHVRKGRAAVQAENGIGPVISPTFWTKHRSRPFLPRRRLPALLPSCIRPPGPAAPRRTLPHQYISLSMVFPRRRKVLCEARGQDPQMTARGSRKARKLLMACAAMGDHRLSVYS